MCDKQHSHSGCGCGRQESAGANQTYRDPCCQQRPDQRPDRRRCGVCGLLDCVCNLFSCNRRRR